MKVFIAGANGFIGRHLVSSCLRQGFEVIACVRDQKAVRWQLPGYKIEHGDFSLYHHYKNWLDKLRDVDVVVNAVGIFTPAGNNTFESLHHKAACALFKASEVAGVKKIIQISALSANNVTMSEYHKSKKVADDYLQTLTIDWTIFLPSIIYGPGSKSWSFFTALAALPVTFIPGKGSQMIQPIHVDDLCSGIVSAINTDKANKKLIEATGPEPMTLIKMFSLLKIALGKTRTVFFHIPDSVSRTLAGFAQMLGSKILTRQALDLLDQGNTGNSRQLEKYFNISPRSMEESIVREPLNKAEIREAYLYFLFPVLKYSLALLWIATGIISAFIYPLDDSFELLNQVGITGQFAAYALYGASALDILLGVAMLSRSTLRYAIFAQLLVIISYSMIITVYLPAFWAHPFGPLLKNIPLCIATLLVLAWER